MSSTGNDPGARLPLRGELRTNEPMARHVSWRAGGAAAQTYLPADLDDFANFMHALRRDEPLLMVGLGSNLLVRDGGYNGTVVFMHGVRRGPSELRLEADGCIYAEAGVASPKLARFAANHQRAEAEFLAGIPGTVGGALAMNAGCYGGETWRYVERVLMIDRQGQLVVRLPEDFTIGYRHVGLNLASDEVFAAAWFRFPAGEVDVARGLISELLKRRISQQPLQLPNAGSVFRNPPGDHAARLIEAAGLKATCLEFAQVSEKHANFIVNPEGKASASAIEMLIGQIVSVVREKFAVELVPEVRIVGDVAVVSGRGQVAQMRVEK